MIFSRLVRPKNSLILLYDHLSEEGMEAFESEIEEVRKYYKMAKLSEVLGASEQAPLQMGFACVLFRQARKSVFLRAVPYLVGESIPFAVGLLPECIGTNRLPIEEEKQIPIEKRDPTTHFATWGDITRVPTELREGGLVLEGIDANSDNFSRDLEFVRRQIGDKVLFCIHKAPLSIAERVRLQGEKILARVAEKTGPVDQGTDRWDLPTWKVSELV